MAVSCGGRAMFQDRWKAGITLRRSASSVPRRYVIRQVA